MIDIYYYIKRKDNLKLDPTFIKEFISNANSNKRFKNLIERKSIELFSIIEASFCEMIINVFN